MSQSFLQCTHKKKNGDSSTIYHRWSDGTIYQLCLRCGAILRRSVATGPTVRSYTLAEGDLLNQPEPVSYSSTSKDKDIEGALRSLEQSEPTNLTEGHDNISAVVAQLATDLSRRLGQSMAALTSVTADSGTQAENINALTQDPAIREAQLAKVQARALQRQARCKAEQEAAEAMERRNKAIEDAARAAAAAFDAGELDKCDPVTLEVGRKLKVVS
jgi:hypothetical protein